MAHWFHRNPFKATAPATFDLRAVASNSQSMKICNDLRHARTNLLEVIANPNNEISTLTSAVNTYFSLLNGFVVSYDDTKPTEDSKLRNIIRFRWTDTLSGYSPTEQYDAIFEVASMMFNVGIWYMKHAGKIAGKDEPSMEEAKETHKCLRIAAGIFTHIREQVVPKLITQPEKGQDLETRVISTYIHQCTGEAQEVTIARAIELKHKPAIVSALAYETARMYEDADQSLSSLEDKTVAKWRKYLNFKSQIYYAYAYNYHGETLLAEDKCGVAIKCLQESKSHYDKASTMGKEYASIKGTGTIAKPTEHLFFRKLGPIVNRTLEKCVRENGFIYHQKVPPEAPQLELKATYGLVAPEEFKVPDPSPLWTAETYKAFDISKNVQPDAKEKKKEDSAEITPVKEADIEQSSKDPKNSSGCVIS